MNHWPYCEIEGCHDRHTRHYSTFWGTGTVWYPPQPAGVRIDLSVPRDPPWGGQRLCRAHALLIWRVA